MVLAFILFCIIYLLLLKVNQNWPNPNVNLNSLWDGKTFPDIGFFKFMVFFVGLILHFNLISKNVGVALVPDSSLLTQFLILLVIPFVPEIRIT